MISYIDVPVTETAADAVFDKTGRITSEELVTVQLLNTECV